MQKDVFCSPEIYRQVYYESKHFIVAYSYFPILPGHSLIIPKRHMGDISEMTAEEAEDMFAVLKKVVPVLLKIYKASDNSYNVAAQIGKYSGRTVPHLHFHIIPRRKGDRFYKDSNELYDKLAGEKARLTKAESTLHFKLVSKEVSRLRRIFRYEPKERLE